MRPLENIKCKCPTISRVTQLNTFNPYVKKWYSASKAETYWEISSDIQPQQFRLLMTRATIRSWKYEQDIQPCHITPPADSITQTSKKKNQCLMLDPSYKAF